MPYSNGRRTCHVVNCLHVLWRWHVGLLSQKKKKEKNIGDEIEILHLCAQYIGRELHPHIKKLLLRVVRYCKVLSSSTQTIVFYKNLCNVSYSVSPDLVGSHVGTLASI